MPFEKVGQPRQHDAADHAIGQIVAERDGGGKRFDAGVAIALFQGQALTGLFAHRGRDAVDHHGGIALDHLEKCGAVRCNALHCGFGDSYGLALPGDSKGGVEVDVPPVIEDDSQEFTLGRGLQSTL